MSWITDRLRNLIEEGQGSRLAKKLEAKEGLCVESADAVKLFREHDPTKKGIYTQWLMTKYLQGEIGLGELGFAKRSLAFFDEFKRLKEFNHQFPTDIGEFNSIAELRAAVFAEAEIVSENGNLILVSPRSERAAKLLGHDTEWCTSRRKNQNNEFDTYNKHGPLLIIVDLTTHGNRKFQMGYGGPGVHQNFSVKGKDNVELEKDFIENHWDVFQEALEWCLPLYKNVIEFIPESLRTPSMYYAAVCKDEQAFNLVPDHKKTYEMCFEAVRNFAWHFPYVPERFRDDELCSLAVNGCWTNLKNVPYDQLTEEMCLTAISKNSAAWQFVPMDFNLGLERPISPRPSAWLIKTKQIGNRLTTETLNERIVAAVSDASEDNANEEKADIFNPAKP